MSNTIEISAKGHPVHFKFLSSTTIHVLVFEKEDPTSISTELVLMDSKKLAMHDQESGEDFVKRVITEASLFVNNAIEEKKSILKMKELLAKALEL